MATRYFVDSVFRAFDKFSQPIAKMRTNLDRFMDRASTGFTKATDFSKKFLGGLKNVALGAAAMATAVGFALKKIIDVGAGFEQAITNVAAVNLVTRDSIQQLEDKARSLGRTTKFTATEVAQGMELMAKAGFSNVEIFQGIEGVLNAAAAEGIDLAETASHVSNVLKGMGLATSDAGRVADVLALASARTNSSISSLGESMANVGSTARQLNVPLEDTVAAVALLQDVGLDASVAGSALNVMLTKMAKPSKEVAAQMEKWGISFKDAKGNMLPFAQVLENISVASDKSGGNLDKVAFLADLVGMRGQKAASNLADLFKEGKFQKLAEELQNASGAAKKMADTRMDTFTGDVKKLSAAIDGIKISLFESSPALREIIRSITDWIDKNKELILVQFEAFLEALPTIWFWIKKIAIVIGILGAVTVNIMAMAAAFKIAAAIVAIASNPFSLIAATIAAIMTFWPEFQRAIQWFIDKLAIVIPGLDRLSKDPTATRRGLDHGPALKHEVVGPQAQKVDVSGQIGVTATPGTKAQIIKQPRGRPGLKLAGFGDF